MVTMSTVGYGDIACVTSIGRGFQVLFLLVGLVSTLMISNITTTTTTMFLANSIHPGKRLLLSVPNFYNSISILSLYQYQSTS